MKKTCAVPSCHNHSTKDSPVLKALGVMLCESHTDELDRSIQETVLEAETMGIEIPRSALRLAELQRLLYPQDSPRLSAAGGT